VEKDTQLSEALAEVNRLRGRVSTMGDEGERAFSLYDLKVSRLESRNATLTAMVERSVLLAENPTDSDDRILGVAVLCPGHKNSDMDEMCDGGHEIVLAPEPRDLLSVYEDLSDEEQAEFRALLDGLRRPAKEAGDG